MVFINLSGEVISYADMVYKNDITIPGTKLIYDITQFEPEWVRICNESCAICKQPVNCDDQEKCHKCTVTLHRTCLQSWFKFKKNCPQCRASLRQCSICRKTGHSKNKCPSKEIDEDVDYNDITMRDVYLRWD